MQAPHKIAVTGAGSDTAHIDGKPDPCALSSGVDINFAIDANFETMQNFVPIFKFSLKILLHHHHRGPRGIPAFAANGTMNHLAQPRAAHWITLCCSMCRDPRPLTACAVVCCDAIGSRAPGAPRGFDAVMMIR